MSDTFWHCGPHRLSLASPLVMGILNITPDSFSDGGQLWVNGKLDGDVFLQRAAHMHANGAAIFDIGGESTRPGANKVSEQEESERILPALELLLQNFDLPVSVDTSTPGLMRTAIAAGAAIINDVRALQRPGAEEAVADSDVGLCLMHMQGQPLTMQDKPEYQHVGEQVEQFLIERANALQAAGVGAERITIDPGFGFGKSLQDNLQLFRALGDLTKSPWPVLIGVSRKSMIGAILDRGEVASDRLAGGLALTSLAAAAGVKVFRTHDVRETVDALAIFSALSAGE